MKVLAIVFAIVGIVSLVRYKKAVELLSKFYTRRFNKTFGEKAGWTNQRYQKVYKVVVVLGALLLLVISCGIWFGPL